jgi:hypothetical protein
MTATDRPTMTPTALQEATHTAAPAVTTTKRTLSHTSLSGWGISRFNEYYIDV